MRFELSGRVDDLTRRLNPIRWSRRKLVMNSS